MYSIYKSFTPLAMYPFEKHLKTKINFLFLNPKPNSRARIP